MVSNENTKLCDFTSHNNSDFICTNIAPPSTSAPSYEIKPALLNLVMKDQFSGAGEDAALHLHNFVELCDMQKYKEVDGDIVKLELFPFSLRGRAKSGCNPYLRIALILGTSVMMLLLGSTIPLLKLSS